MRYRGLFNRIRLCTDILNNDLSIRDIGKPGNYPLSNEFIIELLKSIELSKHADMPEDNEKFKKDLDEVIAQLNLDFEEFKQKENVQEQDNQEIAELFTILIRDLGSIRKDLNRDWVLA